MIKIKTDSFKIKDVMKRGVMVFGVISVSLCIYTIPFALVSDYVVTRKGVKKRYVTIFFTALIFVCCLYVHISDYSAADFIKPYFRYVKNFLLLDPVRLTVASAFNIVFLFHGKLVSEGMEEWSVQEKQKQIEDMLPKGVFNYQNRMHMLVYGSTGAGKGVFLDHLIRYNVENGHFLVFISAKLASTDKYSQLEYCRKMGRLYNIPVYVVSMDATVSDRVQYNPFRFIDEQEMMNALDSMIKVDSHYYNSNFVSWIMAIYDALKISGKAVSLKNILKLYDYNSFRNFIAPLRNKKVDDEERKNELFSDKVKTYASVAANDSASFDLVYRSGRCVFDPSPNGKRITLSEAIKENAIVYFDLNGNSAAAATMMTGVCILAELQHLMKTSADPSMKKTVICDEASFYMSPMLKSAFNVSRSAGYQYIVATQGPSDLEGVQSENAKQLISQLTNNANQFAVLRLNAPSDAEYVASVIGTEFIAETTRRANGIDYDGMGSVKAVPAMIANPNTIKNLDALEMIYLEKKNDGTHKPRPVAVRWSTDDL